MIHHITRATRHLIFWSLIMLAIGLTSVRLLLSGVEHYKFELATHISELVGAPVTIGRMSTKMRSFSPLLVLKDIVIASRSTTGYEKPVIEFNEIRLGIDLWDLLISRNLLSSSSVTLVGARLTIKRQEDGSIIIAGLKAGGQQPQWLLQTGKYLVVQSEINWQDEKNKSQSLLFKGIDLAISNKNESHQLNMSIKLPPKMGNSLRVSMDFKGNIFEPLTIRGRVYIDGKAVLLPELAAFGLSQFPTLGANQIKINSGVGDFKIWGDWQESQWLSMEIVAQLKQMDLVRPGEHEFFVKQLETQFHWALNDISGGASNQWRLDVGDFLLETQDNHGNTKKWPSAVFSASGQRINDNVLSKTALFVEQLDLQEASELVQFMVPLSDEQAKLLAQAQIKGMLENFSLFADSDNKIIAVNGKFSGFSVAPLAQMPGIDNLTGQIQGNEKAGNLRLTTDDAQITATDFFREALIIKRLKGMISWRQTDADWTLSSRELQLNLRGLESINRLSLIFSKNNELPFLDLQSSFVSDDISQAKHYFPAKVMMPADVVWYDNAFLGGRITKGDLLYVGKLGALPAKAEDGVFEVLLEVDQLNLAYAPTWPILSNIAGEVTILQRAMTCEIRQGQSNSLNIIQATVINPALGTSKLLTVKGELEGEIAHVFEFLKQTPLASEVGFLVDAVVPKGDTNVALDLVLPLVDGIMPKVDGIAKFSHADLNVAALNLGIHNINGELKFTERGIYSDTIKAEALGQPIKVNIEEADHQQTFVNITGSAAIDDLQQQFKMPGWVLAKGAASYQLKLGLPYPGSPTELVVRSDLDGVALDLPGLLAKTKSQKKTLLMTFGLDGQALLPIAINYNEQIKAALKLNFAQQRLYSGHVLIGLGEVVQPLEAGLLLEINQDPLNLDEWLGLASHQNNNSRGDDTGSNIRRIEIHSQHAHWKNIPLGAFELSLKPEGNYWLGLINSTFATGKMHIPLALTGAEKIVLNLVSLDLSAFKQPKFTGGAVQGAPAEAELELAPTTLPLISIASDKTLWRSVDLGRLTLDTERIPGGIGFNHMELAGENQKFSLSGSWKVSGGQSVTHVLGHLEAPRIGQLLAQLGITKDLTETSAAVNFIVDWNAAPYQFSIMDLSGHVDIKLTNGRILSIEPGFGRVLGILAMAQWIKRAQLDFSDVYQEGLTFNSINGHFGLAGGIASTDDLVVDAVPAKIVISGDTDFVGQSVDQIINVTPKSADALPIAGTIMDKVEDLVGWSLTGKDQEGLFFGSQYLVKGAWDNVKITSIHKNDGLLQKTWYGITGFPWLQKKEQ